MLESSMGDSEDVKRTFMARNMEYSNMGDISHVKNSLITVGLLLCAYIVYAAVARVLATVAMMVYGAEMAATGTVICICLEYIYMAAQWVYKPLVVLGWISPAVAPVITASPIAFIPASAWTYRYGVGFITGALSLFTCWKPQQQ